MGAKRLAAASIALVAVAAPVLAQDTFRYEAGLSFARMKDDTSRTDFAGLDALKVANAQAGVQFDIQLRPAGVLAQQLQAFPAGCLLALSKSFHRRSLTRLQSQ